VAESSVDEKKAGETMANMKTGEGHTYITTPTD
jgi:hypothetical protein